MASIVDIKPKTGGNTSVDGFIALVVEKAKNGWILKEMVIEGEEIVEETSIYSDRSELLRDLARKI